MTRLAALDYFRLAIHNHHESGNTTMISTPLAILAAFFDQLGRYEAAATIAGFAFSPSPQRLSPSSAPQSRTYASARKHVYESFAQTGANMTTAAMATTHIAKSTKPEQNSNKPGDRILNIRDFHVERDPIDSHRPDGLCRRDRVRVAPAVAAKRIRPDLDEAVDDHQHDHFAEHACSTTISPTASSSTPPCIGLSICPPPPPDAEAIRRVITPMAGEPMNQGPSSRCLTFTSRRTCPSPTKLPRRSQEDAPTVPDATSRPANKCIASNFRHRQVFSSRGTAQHECRPLLRDRTG